MKTNTIQKQVKQYRSGTDVWLVCKPRTGHVEQTTGAREMRLLGLVAPTMETMNPLDLLIAIEAGDFDEHIEMISRR